MGNETEWPTHRTTISVSHVPDEGTERTNQSAPLPWPGGPSCGPKPLALAGVLDQRGENPRVHTAEDASSHVSVSVDDNSGRC